MTRGARRARSRGRAAVLGALVAFSISPATARTIVDETTVPAVPALIGKDELIGLLRAVPGVTAKYREEQHIALLSSPLVSEGTMHFAPPGKLAKHQARPAASRMIVDGGRLAFADAFGRDELELAKNPVVALFVDSVLHVLGGNVEAIERAWYVGFVAGADGDPRAWVLMLQPKAESAARIVDSLSIRGREAVVSRIEIVEKGGDHTITTMSEVDIARRWSPTELAEVFAVGTR